jgi:flagellar motor switch protein FliM
MESQSDVSSRGPGRADTPAYRPESLPNDQFDLAWGSFQQFLKQAAIALAGYLSSPVEIGHVEAGQLSFSDALSNVESGACVTPMDLSPLPGVAHLILGRQLVGAALETLLGAPKDAPEIPRSSLTAVDLHLLQEPVAQLAAEMRSIWEPICGASFLPLSVNAPEACLGAGIDTHSVLVLTAKVLLNGGASTLQIVVPSLLIRLAFDHRRGVKAAATAPCDALLDALGSASFGLEAVLRGSGIRVRDLLDLKAGHTLALPNKTDAPIECQVNGVVKYRGELVSNGESTGFQIATEA